MYRSGFYRGGPILMSSIADIDQAMWDIKGKYHNAPIHQLLGGRVRDKMRVYSWIGGDQSEHMGAAAQEIVDKGFTATKMNATDKMTYVDSYVKIDAVLARGAAVRAVGGPGLGIGIDFHGRVHKPMVLARELKAYRPMFIEEPVLPQNNEAPREIAHNSAIPIATGERMFSRWDFKQLLVNGYTDIIQPDLSHAGGITECKKIISLAEAFDVAAAPHCPLGSIALAACLQVYANCHDAFIQEQSLGIHYNKENDLLDYLVDKSVFNHEVRHCKIPEGSGLGIEINEEYVRQRAVIGHNWHNPVWRNGDGSVAEW